MSSSPPPEPSGPPTYSFLPPTEDLSPFRLLLSVALISCLTLGFCGNVSHFVLQVYSRRFRDGFPVQHSISLLYLLNFLIPLALPGVILEKLVNIWMFGDFSCRSHHVFASLGSLVMPWLIVFIQLFVLFPPSSRLSRPLAVCALSFLAVLFLVRAVPRSMSARVELVDDTSIDEGRFIMVIHITKCLLDELDPSQQIIRLVVEMALPLLFSIFIILRLWMKSEDHLQRIIWKQASYLTLIQFSCNLAYYVPSEWEVCPFCPSDLSLPLPYLAAAVLWIPANALSAALTAQKDDNICLMASNVRRRTCDHSSRSIAEHFAS